MGRDKSNKKQEALMQAEFFTEHLLPKINVAMGFLLNIAKINYVVFKELIVARLLQQIDSGKPYGTKLFDALSRLTWSVAFEAVAIRKNPATELLEVFLRRRADDDTNFPGQWHAPGAAFRPRERPEEVAKRLSGEFGADIAHFHQVGQYFSNEVRGDFLALVYLVKFDGEPRTDGRHGWYPVDALPENTVGTHRDFIIPTAVLAYRSSH